MKRRHPERPTEVQLERLEARAKELHQKMLKAGHLVLRQGNSFECARCSQSGSVACLTGVGTGGISFVGPIFESTCPNKP